MANVMLTVLHKFGHRRCAAVRRQHGGVRFERRRERDIGVGRVAPISCHAHSEQLLRASMVRRSWMRASRRPSWSSQRCFCPWSSRAATAPVSSPTRARHGDREAVKALLKQAADVNAAQGDGMTALHWAAQKNDAELARMLLYAGANVKAATRINAYTPLLLAARAGHAAVMDGARRSGCRRERSNRERDDGADVCCGIGQVEAVKILLDARRHVNAKESVRGLTPLMFAAASDRSADRRAAGEAGRRRRRDDEDRRPELLRPSGPRRLPAFCSATRHRRRRGARQQGRGGRQGASSSRGSRRSTKSPQCLRRSSRADSTRRRRAKPASIDSINSTNWCSARAA